MNEIFNPYKSALDGLTIENPVRAFFQFCKEREDIRFKRESGLPAPWSNDPIFQKGRFLNVFREDDRGSKAIIKFVKQIDSEFSSLVQAIFFSRWCNKQEILDVLDPVLLLEPKKLRSVLTNMNAWCNTTAYPVEPVN